MPHAVIDWQEGGPVSQLHGDVYFSKLDGLNETRHVFLHGNELTKRWATRLRFVVGELGFGSGLNFFATCQEWNRSSNSGFLHYLSIEAAPFSADNIRRAMQPWPELHGYVESFLQVLPQPTVGFHRITFFEQRIILTLCYGQAADILPQISATVDAWYLDGFAPAKNPDLWAEAIFREVARLSAPGATVATFSVARAVRDGLSQVGFAVSKQQGFGRKREMLVAKKLGEVIQQQSFPKSVAIIGSGLAGAHAAYAIASRGAAVTVFEKSNCIAPAASGNPSGMIMPHLSAKPEARMRLSLCAMQQAIGRLRQFQEADDQLWHDCGVLRLVTSQRLRSVFELLQQTTTFGCLAIPMDAQQASAIAGITLRDDAIFFPFAGVASPEKICISLLDCTKLPITVVVNTEVTRMQIEGHGWRIELGSGEQQLFDAVVLASGIDAATTIDLSWMPLEAVRGQIAYLQSNKVLQQLKIAVCYDGYLLPAQDGMHVVGATFEHNNFDATIGEAQQQEIFDRLHSRFSLDPLMLQSIGGRVGFRASTQDRYPVVGAVPKRDVFENCYIPISFSRNHLDYQSDLFYKNLFISSGHASQGLSTTPIAAELIASQLFGEPLPLDKELVDLLNPARILARMLNRKSS